MIEQSARHGVHYQIVDGRLYRSNNCVFEARCKGVEYFLGQLAPTLADLEFVANFYDWPLSTVYDKLPIFSFSKDTKHIDILYPAWSFHSGGPAISLYPTGIGHWERTRLSILSYADEIPWTNRRAIAFFRGSRTNIVRDNLIYLSRRLPHLIDARYTKNQSWKSKNDTLNEEPAEEATFEEHCNYKYLLNLPGVAASFRFRHLFLCQSIVFHVGDEWNEFFYAALQPWVHYIPVDDDLLQLESLLQFAMQHDALMHSVAKRGRAFFEKHLRNSNLLCYWRSLLTEYKKLLNYEVTRDEKLQQIFP